MKGGKRQLESRNGTYGTGRKAGSDPCQQSERRCRTTLAKRIQGTIADPCQQSERRCRTTLAKRAQGISRAVGETALPETESVPILIKMAVARAFSGLKPIRRARIMVRARKAAPGSLGVARMERNVGELGRPQHLLQIPTAGSLHQRKKGEGKGQIKLGSQINP